LDKSNGNNNKDKSNLTNGNIDNESRNK